MPLTANELVRGLDGLITLPDIYLQISRLIEDPDSSTDDIARVISRDPAFTVRLLGVANSPLYRRAASVSSVARAVALIGTAQVRQLALSLSVAKSFAGLPNDLVSMANFWRHSLYCALISRELAVTAGRCDRDALFTAGLLHDIGELILFNRQPDLARAALLQVIDSQDELPVHEAERALMGVDHAEVGAALARQWNLPSILVECIAHHHQIASAERHPREVALVHIANSLALMAEIDDLDEDDVAPIDPLAWSASGLDHDCIAPAVRAAQAEITEIETLFTESA